VTRRRFWVVAAVATVTVAILGAVVRNQVKMYRGRQARAALSQERHRKVSVPVRVAQQRQGLFDLLQPVALANCQLERFGERNDGGYLMCGNLLGEVRSGYSYGISGYDKWGCDISTKLEVTVHQYDCFNTTRPACRAGRTVFHEECVGATAETVEGRTFDTVANQFAKNGDSSKRIVLKIDVEGAEWDSLLAAPDATLQQIDQMSVEFHWVRDESSRWVLDERYFRLVLRLKQFFEVGHIHFNNASCVGDLEPFPTWAYEVLFVSKRLAVLDPARNAGGLHPVDARNDPSLADCQPKAR
jgi:Methyltransferase FkbM domain